MNKFISAILIVALFHAIPAFAEDEGKPKQWTKEEIRFALVLEPALAGVAYLASAQPRAFGVVAVFAPLAGLHAGGPSKPTEWTMVAGFEMIAAYNLTVDKSKVGKQEIFRNNFLALNALFAATMMASWVTEESSKESKVAIHYLPQHQGGRLMLSSNF